MNNRMKLYTIGFTKKDAKTFFNLLRNNGVKKLLDIRLNNSSQLSGFAKGNDLQYFLKEILGIEYIHDLRLSPTKELLDRYKKGSTTWSGYEIEFKKIMSDRDLGKIIKTEYLNDIDGLCLLCSESDAKECHRRLIAEYFKAIVPNIDIIHL